MNADTSEFSVSIVLCTYNGERFLSKQLASFENQTRLPDEILIADDSSTDSTNAIIADFCKKTKIHISHYQNLENIGFRANFSNALAKSTSTITFLADQDDIWNPQKIEIMLQAFKNNQSANVVVSQVELINENDEAKGKLFSEKAISLFQSEEEQWKPVFAFLTFPGTCMAIRTSFLKTHLPIPLDFAHDEWLLMNASLSNSLICIQTALTEYRIHTNQTIGIRKGFSLRRLFLPTKLMPEKRKCEFLLSNLSLTTKQRLFILQRLDFINRRICLRNLYFFGSCFYLLRNKDTKKLYSMFSRSPAKILIKDVFFHGLYR